jgi:hypothetical protein
MGEYLDMRDPMMMVWLPCLWLIKMHEAQADFLVHLVADSTATTFDVEIKKCSSPSFSTQ